MERVASPKKYTIHLKEYEQTFKGDHSNMETGFFLVEERVGATLEKRICSLQRANSFLQE